MPYELPYQQLLEKFGDAFNVEGFAEIPITREGKGKILEVIVERAKWWLGLGHRSQEHQNYQQAVAGVKEIIIANISDPRYTIFSTACVLNVSCSFFDKVCSLVEESERRKTAVKLKVGNHLRSSWQRRLLPAPGPGAQLSSVAAHSLHSAPSFEQGASAQRRLSSANGPNQTPEISNGTTSSKKRKFAGENAVAKQAGTGKGKERAVSSSDIEARGRITELAELPTAESMGQSLLEETSPPVSRAGPSTGGLGLNGSETVPRANGQQLSTPAPGLNEQNLKASSHGAVDSLSIIRQQFLFSIKKAHQAALTPSQRIQLNVCISQANLLEGVPTIPLIVNAPNLQGNVNSVAHSSAANLVRDCQNVMSLAVPTLPSPGTVILAGSAGVPSDTADTPPSKKTKTFESLDTTVEVCLQVCSGNKGSTPQEIPSRLATKTRASTEYAGSSLHAANSRAMDHLAYPSASQSNFGSVLDPPIKGERQLTRRKPLQANTSRQMLPPSVPTTSSKSIFKSVSAIGESSNCRGSGSRRGPISPSIQQPVAIEQGTPLPSASNLIPISPALSSSMPLTQRTSHVGGFFEQTLEPPLHLTQFQSSHQRQQLFPRGSATLIYTTVQPNTTAIATPDTFVGSLDSDIPVNGSLFNGYDEQALFNQYLNIPIEDYNDNYGLLQPQPQLIFHQSGNQMGHSDIGQPQSTVGSIYGQQTADYSQGHFQEVSQQGGGQMAHLPMTGLQLIPPSQFQQQMQWRPGNNQVCHHVTEGDSDQNPIALD